ncbi:magnesium protoporphyrin IX methyltransferase [Sandaracinobacteroides saxicola]|uniref:Magnesium protoporphyrin IX methyltransferase n=1 Tax=Sandaracinobacteroides saxicola TaxID=2759707 RepID=A0A7G5IEJ7_9SPHN|nr:magnesium protoporphyrin IX methyltransferase [Sandaracinobacteroides saxicola]QMW21789.1 magnesium protoporphyrin IX methyltransferase [Sandaracinobacteroides saxicola]
MDATASYGRTREALTAYFDRTAFAQWAALTSDAPVSRIRATVRAGRDRMRALLLDWLPQDLRGARLLDAGCGTGALAVAAAQRGAQVVAVDVSGQLIDLARERAASSASGAGLRIEWLVGDMLTAGGDGFDHVVAMDSLIHYPAADIARALGALSARAPHVVATVAPRTPLLSVMHGVGKLFPRDDRAPAIQPVRVEGLRRQLAAAGLRNGRQARVSSGFYTSQALEVER